MKNWRLLPIGLELVGITMIGVAVGIEVTMHADVGFLMMTVGGWIVAIGGVIWGKFTREDKQ